MQIVKKISLILLFGATTLFSINCKRGMAKKEQIKKDVDGSIPQLILKKSNILFDSSFSQYFFAKYPNFKSIKTDWTGFYKNRNFSYAWIDSAGISTAGINLHNRINNLNSEDLIDSLIYVKDFNALFEKANSLTGKDFKDTVLIETEMMFTAQYLSYAKQLYSSLSTDELKKLGWNIKKQTISYNDFLNKALDKNELFENEPVYYQYNLLKKYLQQYKEIETNGGFAKIDSSINKLLPGDKHPKIFSLKKYLYQVKDLAKIDSSLIYDDNTAKAIKQFRVRHGLKDTTLINEDVIKQMRVPVAQRIKQILVNMERSKWMPVNPENDYISVNIPDYTLNVYEKSKLQFSMNVVVGALATKTVIFSDTMKIIAFSPYWYVPYSIYKKELAGRSAASLRRKNMEYVGPNSVRQLPGPDNALGKVKFLFPNQYNIYFHDTNAKDKFAFSQRAFSHGCIRLSDPKKLANYLLRNDKKYDSKTIDSLMNLRKETQVKMSKPMPVIIGYFTSFVNVNTNLLQFRKDIYNYDDKMLKEILN
jgi:L,D-transpeptidase YcbB